MKLAHTDVRFLFVRAIDVDDGKPNCVDIVAKDPSQSPQKALTEVVRAYVDCGKKRFCVGVAAITVDSKDTAALDMLKVSRGASRLLSEGRARVIDEAVDFGRLRGQGKFFEEKTK